MSNHIAPSSTTFIKWLEKEVPSADLDIWPPAYAQTLVSRHDTVRTAAWELHVELVTRITTQALPLHSGQAQAALKSLHALFGLVRGILRQHGPDVGSIGSLITFVLNSEVRPVTSYWHSVVGEGSFVHPDEAGDFRADLLQLQTKLKVLADFLGYVARGSSYHPDRSPLPQETVTRYSPPPLPATTKISALEALLSAELSSINERRSVVGLDVMSAPNESAGIALSGGGIRSATFSLGVLTALSRAGLYHQLDYLSTVSGGGYTGTLLSTWVTSKSRERTSDALRVSLRAGPFCDDATTEHLRDRSRYFVEEGLLGLAKAVIPIAFGVLASGAAIVLTTILTLPLVWSGAQAISWLKAADPSLVLCSTLAFVGFGLLGTRVPSLKKRTLNWGAVLLIAGCGLIAPAALVSLLSTTLDAMRAALHALGAHLPPEVIFVALPAALTATGNALQHHARALRIVPFILASSPLMVYLVALNWLSDRVQWPGFSACAGSEPFIVWLEVLIASILILALSDVNEHSPLGFYRDRLASAYCITTNGSVVTSSNNLTSLSGLSEWGPIHLINATVNIPASRARNDRGRGAATMVFSKHGWTHPRERDGRITYEYVQTPPASLTVDMAMAISGAAVSPWMGLLTPRGVSPWLTLLGLRLNAWIPNPANDHQSPRRRIARLWLNGRLLLKEFFGKISLNDTHLNVSDGGHFENLGVYELIRRECKYIIAIDGEADPELTCGSLMNLVRQARVDFGTEIRIDPRPLKLNVERFSGGHVAVGHIDYGSGHAGTLLYIKLSVTGDERAHLLAYRSREPSFPHHSTTDQLFNEEQFECYRALGQHIGESLFRPELVGNVSTVAQRFALDSSSPAVNLGEWIARISGSLSRSAN